MNKKTTRWIEDASTNWERSKINAKRRATYAKNLERRGMNAFIRNSFVMVSALAITSITVGGFFSDNVVSFQSPIVIEKRTSDFQNPIAVVSAKERPTPTPIPVEEVFEKAYSTVWLHESGSGTNLAGLNGDCVALGMINEIGYAPGQGICFADRTHQKDTFLLWMRNRLGKNCVKTGYCRESVGDLLRLYSNNEYKPEVYQAYDTKLVIN